MNTVFLNDDQDVVKLKDAILGAVRSGGDFVEFWVGPGERMSFLITPGLPVRFEIVAVAVEEPSDWNGRYGYSDMDYDLEIPA
jgi:hypothetical protein